VSCIELVDQGAQILNTRQRMSILTASERAVLRRCAVNNNLIQVAGDMGISTGTLKNHLSVIYSKLNLNALADISLYYFPVFTTRPKTDI